MKHCEPLTFDYLGEYLGELQSDLTGYSYQVYYNHENHRLYSRTLFEYEAEEIIDRTFTLEIWVDYFERNGIPDVGYRNLMCKATLLLIEKGYTTRPEITGPEGKELDTTL